MVTLNSVTNLGRSGLSSWLIQRVSAVILLAYFLCLGCAILGGPSYPEWKALFENTWMKVFSIMAILSLAMHAWIGIWAVLTDYLTERMMGAKGNILRGLVQLICGITLFTYVIWGIQILWG